MGMALPRLLYRLGLRWAAKWWATRLATLMALKHINFIKGLPMNLQNPKLTVQNTDSGFFLVRMEHQLGEMQHIDISVLVKRDNEGIGQIQKAAMQQVIALLQTMSDSL